MTQPTPEDFFAPQRELTQFFDDLDRFTIWDVATQAENLEGIEDVETTSDYSHITEGFAPERATLEREDGSFLSLVFTTSISFDDTGQIDEETITGWQTTIDDEPSEQHAAHGSLDGLYNFIHAWADSLTPVVDDDTPVFSRSVTGPLGGKYTLYWKMMRHRLPDGTEERTWDRETFVPCDWTSDPYNNGEVMSPGVHFFRRGGSYTAKQVDSVDALFPGSFALIPE